MHKKVCVNDIHINYDESGTGKDVLVFLHGLGENIASWQAQIDYFQQTFRVITPEMRGHAQSDDGEEVITLALMVKDIFALLDQLDIKQAHFCGLSMGALLCQEIAVQDKSRILSMTLANGAGFYPEEMATTGLEARLKRIEDLSMQELGYAIAKAASKPDTAEEQLIKTATIFQANRKKPYAQATQTTLTADYRAHHASMGGIPTFILVGELDPVTPIAFSQYLNEHILGSKMQILPKVSHLSKIDDPMLFSRALTEFLCAYSNSARLLLEVTV
ncbi:alpha/beta fold hydrolase [Entomospira culicis]|uniref:Alpha/beta fold hydrolase n=1 Tax=Entomospira culicis TaxID=2719989 RepID=A0A968GL91_9SPIO|nr:alpha/beta fold hydrolase [Entomospira culicis]NIZ19651.1 alpha/beta fold hydrolase [Entomospira culicis]NIZ69865.1 alpha/beta fold hydrolase [Entomospira culicis]WDI36971.1 alpha/beta fold hydrolase [Entomospira culicis]WDI38600.1 alpha/beta fold hydrolase [Entomospira culicis]